MNSPVIKPTVGRVVWFYPSQNTVEAGFARHADGGGPYAALIAHVWNDRMVNLSVFDANGAAHPRTSVTLHQGEGDVPEQAFCGWMPYQKGQAAKTEAAEKATVEVPATPQYREPSQRDRLECALVSGAAAYLATDTNAADSIASSIKKVLDVLHPIDVRQQRVPDSVIVALSDMKIPSTALSVVDPGPDSLEREIQAKANKAPRVTPAALQAEIVSAHYFTASDGVVGATAALTGQALGGVTYQVPPLHLLTFCVLVLRNGFTVHGISACASPENYNKEIGERIARENAEREIWPLLGFRLRDELARTT